MTEERNGSASTISAEEHGEQPKSIGSSSQLMLSLFESDQTQYSNLIDIYDMLPKYVAGKDRRAVDLATAEMKRVCKIGNKDYKVIIKPAIIKDDEGRNILVYPGEREEIVEFVLRKFAVEGQASMMSDQVGVVFTLYQVKKELESRSHSYSIKEIREALMVLRGATLECHTVDGESVISSSFFQAVALTTRDDWQKNGTGAKCMVMFNPMVTRSVMNMSWRPYNYLVNMGMTSRLARFIHIRLSNNYKQASNSNPYSFLLVNFLKSSERGLSKRMPENIRAIKNALDHLTKHKVLEHYDIEKIMDGKATRDARCTLYPHKDFISDTITANKTMKDLTKAVEENKKADISKGLKKLKSSVSK